MNKIFNDTKHDIDAHVPMWCRVIAAVAPVLAVGGALGLVVALGFMLFKWVMA